MSTFWNAIVSAAVATSLAVTGMFGYVPSTHNAGATIPKVVALFESSLASKITKTDTSFTLVTGTDKANNPITGYIGFVIDEGTASEEFVAGTASGTSITSVIRGIDPVSGNTTSSALAYEHRRGSSVKITTFPVLGIISRQLSGLETIATPIKYDSGITTSSIASNASNLASVGYVNSIAFGGITMPVGSGGTGASTFTPGVLYGNGTTAITSIGLPLGSAYISSSSDYTWTGKNTFTSGTVFSALNYGVVIASGTANTTTIAPGAYGNTLVSNGTSWVSSVPTANTVAVFATSSACFTVTGGGVSYNDLYTVTSTELGLRSTKGAQRYRISTRFTGYGSGAILATYIKVNGKWYGGSATTTLPSSADFPYVINYEYDGSTSTAIYTSSLSNSSTIHFSSTTATYATTTAFGSITVGIFDASGIGGPAICSPWIKIEKY
jgi:hypothetical protein